MGNANLERGGAGGEGRLPSAQVGPTGEGGEAPPQLWPRAFHCDQWTPVFPTFFGGGLCLQHMEVPVPGIKRRHSSGQSHSSNDTGSLTHCATWELFLSS